MKIKNFILCILTKLGLIKKNLLCEKSFCKKKEAVAPTAKVKATVSAKPAAVKKSASTRKKP